MKPFQIFFFLLLPLLSCINFVRDNPYDPNNIDYRAPNIISATKEDYDCIEIRWQANQEGIKEFIIYRGEVNKFELTEIIRTGGGCNSYKDYSIKNEITYYYAVEAILIDNKISERSNIAEGSAINNPKIVFPDSSLEKVVREAIKRPVGNIRGSHVTGLIELNAYSKNISSLNGIQELKSLQKVYLGNNNISDISPLASLKNITKLDLHTNNIQNIAPLDYLTNLTHLYLGKNNITDLNPLSSLSNLTVIELYGNRISDLQPLVNNRGLTQNDTIYIKNNPLSTEAQNSQIPALEGRGVSVYWK